jgi:hypothetical protein
MTPTLGNRKESVQEIVSGGRTQIIWPEDSVAIALPTMLATAVQTFNPVQKAS